MRAGISYLPLPEHKNEKKKFWLKNERRFLTTLCFVIESAFLFMRFHSEGKNEKAKKMRNLKLHPTFPAP